VQHLGNSLGIVAGDYDAHFPSRQCNQRYGAIQTVSAHIGNIGFASFQINEMNARYMSLAPTERFERFGAGSSKPKEMARPRVSIESIRKQPESWSATHDHHVLAGLGTWSEFIDLDLSVL
jgi:hypothetical protein